MAMPIALAVIEELSDGKKLETINKENSDAHCNSEQITHFFKKSDENEGAKKIKLKKNLEKAIILAVPYACNIGGLATVNGSGRFL